MGHAFGLGFHAYAIIVSYLPRDFIETADGLIFAVVDDGIEDGRVLCFLRYLRGGTGFRKLPTEAATTWLEAHAPAYPFRSKRLDAPLHGVPLDAIQRHFRPRDRVRQLLRNGPADSLEKKALWLLESFAARGLNPNQVGLTGSLLIGAQTPASDLDFVIYGRDAFHLARDILRCFITAGEVEEPGAAAWHEAYARRGCTLGFEDWLWHERRKWNKGWLAGTKFDLTLIGEDVPTAAEPVRKLGPAVLRAEVSDARYAHDCPARYRLKHPEVSEALSFTHTYSGQAEAGETVEIAGILEATATGRTRIVVGTSREAPGEYIRVIPAAGREGGSA